MAALEDCVENDSLKRSASDHDLDPPQQSSPFSLSDLDGGYNAVRIEPTPSTLAEDPFTSPGSGELDFYCLSAQKNDKTSLLNVDIMDPGGMSMNMINPPESRLVLTIQDEMASVSSYSSVSSPELLSPSHSGITSPEMFVDSATQMSLIQNAADLRIDSDTLDCGKSVITTDIPAWFMKENNILSSPPAATTTPTSDNSAVVKTSTPTLSPLVVTPKVTNDVTTTSEAMSTSFIFTQFGTGVPGVFSLGSNSNNETTVTSDSIPGGSVPTICPNVTFSHHPPAKRHKQPPLNISYPPKNKGMELKIVKHPEDQHRARYMTEGSRGAVKDRSGMGHPVIKLEGYEQPCKLQVFVGTDTGKVRPHGFYQACKISGKNSTPCIEKDIDGTCVIEMDFEPSLDMTVCVDCVGILKLRNADVEQRIGLVKSKKRSTKARLVFRCQLEKDDGSFVTLQTSSQPILCTQPVGLPEISKQSLSCCKVSGGEEVFVIGKNFMKGTTVLFQETSESGDLIWERYADIDNDYFHQTHMIFTVPEYKTLDIKSPVDINILVRCAGRVSEPNTFQYLPETIIKQEPMEIDKSKTQTNNEVQQCIATSLAFSISPVAVELNKLIQQPSSTIFQLPPSIAIPAIYTQNSNNIITKTVPVLQTTAATCTVIPLHKNSVNALTTLSDEEHQNKNLTTVSQIQETPVTTEGVTTEGLISNNAPMLASLLTKELSPVTQQPPPQPESPTECKSEQNLSAKLLAEASSCQLPFMSAQDVDEVFRQNPEV